MSAGAWFAPGLETLRSARGRGASGQLGWLTFRGHRAQVLVPCDDFGPLGVLRRWQSRDLADQERRMLEALAKDEPVVVAATLPKHLGTYVHADVTISLQSFLPGEPISKGVWRTPPAEVLSVVRAVADWFVARFAAREPTPAFPNHLTDTIAGRLWRRTPGQAAQQSFSQFVAEASHLRSECGVIHNDLHPGNLLFNRTARLSGVLDWEHAGYGPLLCDWFGFVNEYALWLLGERGGVAAVRRALENAWSRRSPLLAVAREQSLRIVANSKTTEAGVLACWRLASFRFAYARSHDERAVAQDLWIDALGRAPSFSRD